MTRSRNVRRAGAIAAIAATPFALAWRFAHVYRSRAGFPKPMAPTSDPADFALPFETRTVRTADGLDLPAWWIPARGGGPASAVVLVHGWESARHRTLPNAQFLHALGYHVLTIDVRGHGENAPETAPVSAGEFGADALAAVEAALGDARVTRVAILGHSMGSIGAILAAAAEPRVAAVVLTATPADPYRLTRQTFRLARIPLPDLLAYPLAWITTRVYLQPRRHTVEEISASSAIRRYQGPILAIHGTDDRIVPVGHLGRLLKTVREARHTDPDAAPVEELVIAGGQHSWLYEYPAYRAAIGRFLAESLPGSLVPDEAARVAEAVDARRPAEPDHAFSAISPDEPGPMVSASRSKDAAPDALPAPADAASAPDDTAPSRDAARPAAAARI